MERNRELRRTVTAPANGLSRRRHRISPGEFEGVQRKERDEDLNRSKRRKAVKDCGDGVEERYSSEEYFEEYEEELLSRYLVSSSTTSSSASRNHGLRRSSRSSAADEVVGVPVPRKARSGRRSRASAKRNTEDIGSSTIQDDIEIEVAEALFDLMKQSHPQLLSEGYQNSEGTSDKLEDRNKKCLTEAEYDDNAAISVQNGFHPGTEMKQLEDDRFEEKNQAHTDEEMSLKNSGTAWGEPFIADRSGPKKNEVSNGPAFEPIGNRALRKDEELAYKTEEEFPSCTELDELKATKGNMTLMNDTKRETKFEIDQMEPAPMLPSPERNGLVDVQMRTEKDEHQAIGREEERIPVSVCTKQELPKIHLIEAPQSKVLVSEGKKLAHYGLLPFPIPMPGWTSGLPFPGYISSLPTAASVDKNAKSTSSQPPPFLLLEPRPKRCATHQHIACNIQSHQKAIKDSLTSSTTAPATSYAVDAHKRNTLPTVQKTHSGNMLEVGLSGSRASPNVPGIFTRNEKTHELPNVAVTKSQQNVYQQAPQVLSGNLMHGQAYIFPFGQQQAGVGANNQSESTKSTTTTGSDSLSSNRARGQANGYSLPPSDKTMSFSFPNFPANAAPPYMAMLRNNGYPFPVPTTADMPPAMKGGKQAPVIPFFNGSYYPPMFQISQVQQQGQSQPLVQTAVKNTGTSGGSSPSNRKTQSQHQMITQVTSNILTPPCHQYSKLEAELSVESRARTANNWAMPSHKPNKNQNLPIPGQPMNMSLMPFGKLGEGSIYDSHGEQKHQGSKSGADIIPRTFALPYISTSMTSPVNFPSMLQNPAIFQMPPGMARHGYQGIPSTQMADFKNVMLSKVKDAASPAGKDGGKVNFHGTSAGNGNVVYSGIPRNKHRPASADVVGVSLNAPMSQQEMAHHQQQVEQFIQIQKQQLHQMNSAGAAESKASNAVGSPNKFSINIPDFASLRSQNNSGQYAQWNNLPIPTASLVAGSPSNKAGGAHRTASSGSNTGSPIATLPSQQTEPSSTGATQKASPVCGRNLPLLLSTPAGHISELKY